MPRIWSGSLTFSLVTIPVTVEAATSSHKIGFRQVHLEDMGRVRYRKMCELDEQVLDQDDIGRAYEAPDGTLVEITDDELDEMPLPTLRTIEVDGFVTLESVPPEQLDKPYFLAPSSPAANKPYALMRDALNRSGKAAVGKLAMRGSEHLALVHARDDILVLQLLHWPDELRSSADAAPRQDIELSDDELAGAAALIDSMSGVRIEDYRDEYAAAVEAVLTAKMEGAAPPKAPAAAAEGKGAAVDLMSALEASVSKARGGRGKAEGEGEADVTHLHEERAARKKTAAAKKKTAAKKSAAAKKQPAKKSASRTKRAG